MVLGCCICKALVGEKVLIVSGGILRCEPTLKARLERLAFFTQPRIDEKIGL